MIALIDADSICYIIGWHFKDAGLEHTAMVETSCDSMLTAIFKATNATKYLGSFSSKQTFRHDEYKYAAYKANRKPKDEWAVRWEPVIKNHLQNVWHFHQPKSILEADDVICATHEMLKAQTNELIICSPDKDLQQIEGLHFNYKKMEEGIKHVDNDTAGFNFWLSMLMGDTTDNVKGLPGIGPVKAKAMLIGLSNVERCHEVKMQYNKFFGEYYGPMIYQETLIALQLLCKDHPVWAGNWDWEPEELINTVIDNHLYDIPKEMFVENEPNNSLLKELGWG